MEAWLNFAIVGFAALLLFITCALFERRIHSAPQLLIVGVIFGIALGLLSDYVLSGIFSYTLGYGLPYLILNAAVIYGLFTATVLLLQQTRLTHFVFWIIAMATVYETANYFFPVWSYGITSAFWWVAFVFIGNFATAFFIILIARLFSRYRVRFIAGLAKRQF